MKIKKLNEDVLTNSILEEFIENIIEYFNVDENGILGPYHSSISTKNNKRFIIDFQFLVLEKDDLKKLLEVYNYCKTFDNTSDYYIYPEHVGDDLNAVGFQIEMSTKKFDSINDDLNRKFVINKYNV